MVNLSITFIYQNIKMVQLSCKCHEWKMGFSQPSQLLSCFYCVICGCCNPIHVESKGLVLCKSAPVLWEFSFNVKLSIPLRGVLCCPEHSDFSVKVQSGYRLPCTAEKGRSLFKNFGPLLMCLHFCPALYLQHLYTVHGTIKLFFLESLLSKPNTNQQISKR